MKLITWNVNGIRAILRKDFHKFITNENPDILCLQETKAHPDQVDVALHNYEHHFWNSAEKKGYSGTAIFSKIKPKSVSCGIGIDEHDKEGRVITLEFSDFFLINAYVPNSGRGLPRLKYRERWDEDFLEYLKKLDKKKAVVLTGDLNVAHTEIDLANPKSNYNKTAGYTQKEIDGFERMLKAGFMDSFRKLYPDRKGAYTYWSPMANCRAHNIGWRIDYWIISERFMKNVKDIKILDKVMGSDHCPVEMELK